MVENLGFKAPPLSCPYGGEQDSVISHVLTIDKDGTRSNNATVCSKSARREKQ